VSRSLSGRATRIGRIVVALAFGVMEHGKGKLRLRKLRLLIGLHHDGADMIWSDPR
jgi:hypothetical protein